MIIFNPWGEAMAELPEGPDGGCCGVSIEGMDLSLAKIHHGRFAHADFYWVSFFEADLSGSDFSRATLRGVDLKSALCHGARFVGTRFMADELALPCELQGADFRGAVFEGAEFLSATYSRKTQWPEGFDASQHPGLLLKPD